VLRVDPPHRRGAVAAFEYGGALATAIARSKYHDRPEIASGLGLLLAATARPCVGPDAADQVVPVPLHPRRLAQRGYNQAALLAAPVARALTVRMATRAVARVRDTPRQATLDRAARLLNMQGSFVANRSLVQGSRILLVDDVRTTGATLQSCAEALQEAGARAVLALVVADTR
jgi:ComF family protein